MDCQMSQSDLEQPLDFLQELRFFEDPCLGLPQHDDPLHDESGHGQLFDSVDVDRQNHNVSTFSHSATQHQGQQGFFDEDAFIDVELVEEEAKELDNWTAGNNRADTKQDDSTHLEVYGSEDAELEEALCEYLITDVENVETGTTEVHGHQPPRNVSQCDDSDVGSLPDQELIEAIDSMEHAQGSAVDCKECKFQEHIHAELSQLADVRDPVATQCSSVVEGSVNITLQRAISPTPTHEAIHTLTASQLQPSTSTQPTNTQLTRPAIPDPVPDRSPIDSLTPSTTLHTCFRLGHALQTGSASYRANPSHLHHLEIYARVAHSYREIDAEGTLTGKQFFDFVDVVSDKGPVVQGRCEGWLGVPLLEEDTGAFLTKKVDGEMRMCRCIARMERSRERKWVLRVVSVWECGWEDVLHVYGIVCA